jgi:hypothetical protein
LVMVIVQPNQNCRPMKRTSAPPPVAAPETEPPSPSAESVALASEPTPDRAAAPTPAPYEIPERGEYLHYAQHWGINE